MNQSIVVPPMLLVHYELPPLLAARSGEWPRVRYEHLQIEKVCQVCIEDDLKMLEVHHILPYHIYAAKELDPKNLITLCHFCHFLWGHGRNWKHYNPQIRNHVVRIRTMLHVVTG